jgi:KaiC/GvpD/RAD55 family RecA-like ATPase
MIRKRVAGRKGIAAPIELEGAGQLQDIPEPTMLVEGLIPQGAIIMIEGPSHTGKTFFAFELARAIATSQPFLGHYRVGPRGNTLVVEQDSPKVDAGRVAWAMFRDQYEEREYLGFRDDQPLDGIAFAWHQGLDLWNGNDVASIIRAANEVEVHALETDPVPTYDENGDQDGWEHITAGVKLVILDSFRSLHTAEENDSTEMELIMQDIKWMRSQTGSTILIVHHENADGTRPRGSTAIEAAADMIFKVGRRKNSTLVTLQVTKGRIVQPNGLQYQIVTTKLEDGTLRKHVRFVKEIAPQGADEEEEKSGGSMGDMQALIYGEPRTRVELLQWAEATNVSRATIDNWLKELKEMGLITGTRSAVGTTYSRPNKQLDNTPDMG